MRASIVLLFVAVASLLAPRGLAQTDLGVRLGVPERGGDLRVLVWNIQRGAENFDDGPAKALAVVRAIQPDICLLQESYANDVVPDGLTLGRWMARELGWNAYQGESPHLCVLTPLEIRETFYHEAWHALGATIETGRGRVLTCYSIWIDWREYTPYALRDNPGLTDEELLLHETERSGRYNQTQAIIAHLEREEHLASEVPVLVGGDFNCPSHLDWTAQTSKVFRHRRALDLPVSIAMANAGLVDVFRVVHPDPVQAPGITWSPLYVGSDETPETADRIDRLYLKDPVNAGVISLRPVAAMTLPVPWEAEEIPQAEREFPSDHGAVVVEFVWEQRR